MTALSLVASLCLLAVAQVLAAGPYTCPSELISKFLDGQVHVKENHVQATFSLLDMAEPRGKITEADLAKIFTHPDVQYGIPKFIALVDGNDEDKDVNVGELTTYMQKPLVTRAVIECTLLKSNSMQKYCFGDQLLTYVLLVLDDEAVHKFFDDVDPNDDNEIKKDELAKLTAHNPKFTQDHYANFMFELAKGDDKITEPEFSEYVRQEDLNDDFRVCRTKGPKDGYKFEYDLKCMVTELTDWTMNHLTELDIATTFDVFDQDNDFDIEEDEFMAACKKAGKSCDADDQKDFLKRMDFTKDKKVTYQEFRTYVTRHSVRYQLEKYCSKPIVEQNKEIDCYTGLVIDLIKENHVPNPIYVPDLHMVVLFEDLDVDNDGVIEVSDLVKKGWSEQLAQKMTGDMDSDDADNDVSLEEFNDAVDHPNMVFNMADCLAEPKSKRIDCYNKELMDSVDVMLTAKQVQDFFRFYDKDYETEMQQDPHGKLRKITLAELKQVIKDDAKAKHFAIELGQGDDIITFYEFKWFVRLQDLGHLLKGVDCGNAAANAHETVLKYIESTMTHTDILMLFVALDKNENGEIDAKELGDAGSLIASMDVDKDKDKMVNRMEFWLFFMTPKDSPRRLAMADTCVKGDKCHDQDAQLTCFKTNISKMPGGPAPPVFAECS